MDLESNVLSRVPVGVLKDSKVHNMNLKGNKISKKELMGMEGVDEYQ